MVRSAGRKLQDARNGTLSPDSRFILACDAAHSLALAALRWYGFRPDNRYIVFPSLGATLSLSAACWRFLDNCHQKRNVAFHDGEYEEDEQLTLELVEAAGALQGAVTALGAVGQG